MALIQDEVCICTVPKTYISQPRQIKYFIYKPESAQQYSISNKQNNMVENINQHQILWWACAHLHFKLVHQ